MVNIRKKAASLIAVTLLLLSFAAIVLADAIVEPRDEFFARHKDSIYDLNRFFIINGSGGSTTLHESPGKETEIGIVQNQTEAWVTDFCLYDGAYWGYDILSGGWLRLEETLVIYDEISFREEYGSSLYIYDGDYKEVKEATTAIVWSFPGSGVTVGNLVELDVYEPRIYQAYKDADGREWGYYDTYYGNRGGAWLCLSDPINAEIPAFNEDKAPTRWSADSSGYSRIEGIETEDDQDSLMLIIFIALAVVVIIAMTIVLIKLFWKPNNKVK